MDPFSNQRDATNDPFTEQKNDQNLDQVAGNDEMAIVDSSPTDERRMSKEWGMLNATSDVAFLFISPLTDLLFQCIDASKVPPSQFQKRKGSIYSTPNSRDSHIKGSDRDKAYFDKLKEKV
jgi:hypothetical protein